MANEKLSQLTAITTPVATDDLYVIQGGISLRISLLQIKDFVEAGLDADNIPFSDPSTGGLTSGNVGDALRELDDAIDQHLMFPSMPEYPFISLPDPAAYPRMFAYALDTIRGDVPVYSTGIKWRFYSDDSNAYGAIPTVQMVLSFANIPILDFGSYPASTGMNTTGTAPFVIGEEIPSVDMFLSRLAPVVRASIPVPVYEMNFTAQAAFIDVVAVNPVQHVPDVDVLLITSAPTVDHVVVNPNFHVPAGDVNYDVALAFPVIIHTG